MLTVAYLLLWWLWAAAVVWLIYRRLELTRDMHRAVLLTRMADETAAFVVGMNPRAPFAVLLDLVVKQLAAAAGVPTRNLGALQRAAAAALARFNKLPT